jgi:hypothetical protein
MKAEIHNSEAALAPDFAFHIALPASLTRQFDSLKRRLWRIDALAALTGGVGSLLLSFALQFVSDRFWDTPALLRVLFAVCGWGGFAVFAIGYGNRWIWKRRSIRELAVIVQKRYRRLGDRLLGIVELADPGARPSNYSVELCHAAIAQVAGEASSFDFGQAAVQRQSRRQLIAFGALALLVLAVAIVAPDAGRNALMRWFWPTAKIDRYTFVTIDSLPHYLVVAKGEPFDIAVGVARNSFWRPQTARSHFGGQPETIAPIHDGIATFHLPGQTEDCWLWLSVGDVTRAIKIRPVVRTDLRQLRARLTLPAYLQYPDQEKAIDSGGFTFLPGTSAVFTGEAMRDLASATLAGDKPTALAIDGVRFTTAPLLLELERDVTFTWRDTLGLAGPGPTNVHVTPVEDQPPQVELRGLEAAIGILPEETVSIDLASTDDYGVKRLSLAWQTAPASPMESPGPLHQIKIADGQPQAKTLGGHYDFNPALLDIPAGTTVVVRGLAVDYFPDRKPSSSAMYRIHVLDRDAHAQLIHDQFEKLMNQLEELTRRQSALLQSGKAVRSQNPQQLANDDSSQKLAGQSSEQKQTASELKDLAKQIAKTLAEAMRNPEISPDTLKTWAAHAEEMSKLASSSMPQAAQSLDSAKSDAANRSQNLDQALAQEQQILDAMRQMGAQASKDLDTLTARTLASRLRREAGLERDLSTDFQQMLPDTIGLKPDQLTSDARQKLNMMSVSQTEATREEDRIEGEISRLYDRTSLGRYGDVAHEMTDYKTQDGLLALGKLVDKNIGVQSIGTAQYWGEQFDRWAAHLEQSDNSQSQKPGGQPGQPDAAQMQALMALSQLRQRQDQLREQTAVIDEEKGTSQDYSSEAQDAAQQQGELRDHVQALEQDPTFPIPPEKLAPVGKAMSDAAGLLAKPETGQPTNDAQTDAINLLDAAIAQQAQKTGQGASALMAMMGMGGNTSGGTTNKPNVSIPGTREGPAPDARSVNQAGGVDNSELPGEFRDAIESYHRAIEQSQ